MPFNQYKKYPELLEIMQFDERIRKISLRNIFDRDITNNINFKFNEKVIRPTKKDGAIDLGNVFNHLITEDHYYKNEKGKEIKKRVFEKDRSERLHWLKIHTDQKTSSILVTFSVEERDKKKRKDVIRTYILNEEKEYVIVLEPQNSNKDYYLLSAYHLNKDYGLKQLKKKIKKKLPKVY